jgi:predicted methyltransferase
MDAPTAPGESRIFPAQRSPITSPAAAQRLDQGRMVYHMLTDPEPMARSFYHALKPGGVLAILEGDPEPGQDNARGVQSNRAGMGIDPQIVIAELAEVGFQLDRHIKDWTGADYALVFRKPHARD